MLLSVYQKITVVANHNRWLLDLEIVALFQEVWNDNREVHLSIQYPTKYYNPIIDSYH